MLPLSLSSNRGAEIFLGKQLERVEVSELRFSKNEEAAVQNRIKE